MAIRSILVSGLETLRKRLYRGRIKQFARSSGLEKRLRSIYSALLRSVSDEDIVAHEVAGRTAQFHVTTGLEIQRFNNLMDESAVLETLIDDVTETDVFYDIGANVGLYTCIISPAVNRAVAFEPHPENLQRLTENIELNNLPNITIRSEALSDSDGRAELAITGSNVAGEGTHSLANDDQHDTITITTRRGDSIQDELPAPDIVKIDVEGAEMNVLRGMGGILDGCRAVYCETHAEKLADRGESHQQVVELLTDAGFSVDEIESRGEETFLRCVK